MTMVIENTLIETKIYDTYWRFAAERQNIFWRRFFGEKESLTDDSILKKYKFTNTYRASDRTSQYLIRNVIYREKYSAEDMIFRILLFKTFNRISTWEMLGNSVGEISYTNFKINQQLYISALESYYQCGNKLYSGAYIMTSGKTAFGFERKFRNHIALLDFLMKDHIAIKIGRCKGLKELYELLIQYPTIGEFLAYQYAIDINYSEIVDFDEMEFVIAGPGAKAGIQKCFLNYDDYDYSDIIRFVCERQEMEFEQRGIDFKSLWGRKLQLIDCQNVFCETDKYSRVRYPNIVDQNGRKRIKQKYKKTENRIDYYYPPKWNLNEKIQEEAISKW